MSTHSHMCTHTPNTLTDKYIQTSTIIFLSQKQNTCEVQGLHPYSVTRSPSVTFTPKMLGTQSHVTKPSPCFLSFCVVYKHSGTQTKVTSPANVFEVNSRPSKFYIDKGKTSITIPRTLCLPWCLSRVLWPTRILTPGDKALWTQYHWHAREDMWFNSNPQDIDVAKSLRKWQEHTAGIYMTVLKGTSAICSCLPSWSRFCTQSCAG